MPPVVVRRIVADDANLGLLVDRPIVGGGGLAVERDPSGRGDIDEIVGDRPALRIDRKVALKERSAEHDQMAPGEASSPTRRIVRVGEKGAAALSRISPGRLFGGVHAAAEAKSLARDLCLAPRFPRRFLSAVFSDGQARLISLMMTSRITAPIKASIIAPTISPPEQGNPDLRKQPAGDEAADDADDDVADQAKTAAFDDHAGQPAGNRADDQPNDNAHDPLYSRFGIRVPPVAKLRALAAACSHCRDGAPGCPK